LTCSNLRLRWLFHQSTATTGSAESLLLMDWITNHSLNSYPISLKKHCPEHHDHELSNCTKFQTMWGKLSVLSCPCPSCIALITQLALRFQGLTTRDKTILGNSSLRGSMPNLTSSRPAVYTCTSYLTCFISPNSRPRHHNWSFESVGRLV
jgi:hypothetical protein